MHTTKSAAAFLGVSEASIRRWSDAGLLPVQRSGRRGDRRFREADLRRLQAQEAGSVEAAAATAGRSIEVHDHFATFYDGDAGRLRLSVPFLRAGLAAGERCILVASEAVVNEYLGALGEDGTLDVEGVVQRGDLVVRQGAGSAARDALAAWKELWWQALATGATAIRVVGEMATYVGFPSDQEMLDYEVAYDSLCKRFPVRTLCQYDVRHFKGECVFAAIQAHPDLFGQRIADFLL